MKYLITHFITNHLTFYLHLKLSMAFQNFLFNYLHLLKLINLLIINFQIAKSYYYFLYVNYLLLNYFFLSLIIEFILQMNLIKLIPFIKVYFE